MGRSIAALLAMTALVIAGCGGDDGSATKGSGDSVVRGPLPPRECSSLTVSDVKLVSSLIARQLDLTRDPDEHVQCASAFVDNAGGLIVEIRQTEGNRAALKRLRRTTAQQLGRKTVRQLAGLGPGAFVARRVLAFARGGRVVRLDTGYNREGQLALTIDQLTRLARVVASRL